MTEETRRFFGQEIAPQQKMDDDIAARFLTLYSKTGRKVDSAHSVGLSYPTVRYYEKHSEEFRMLMAEAKEMYLNRLEAEAYRRGVEGVPEPMYSAKGDFLQDRTVYSDKLLELLMRKADPEGYGGKASQTNVNVNVGTGVMRVPATVDLETTDLPVEEVEDEA